MAVRNIVPERDFSQGETFESIPINANRLERYSKIMVHRMNWPDTGSDVIRVTQLYSPDNGQTWMEFGGFTAVGGTLTNPRNGNPITFHPLITSPFPGDDNPQRRLKVRVETFAPLTTKIDAETSETVLRLGME